MTKNITVLDLGSDTVIFCLGEFTNVEILITGHNVHKQDKPSFIPKAKFLIKV